MPADEPLLVPRREQGRHVIDLVAVVFRERSHEHHLLKHVVGRVILGLEEREGGIADKALRLRGLEELGNFLGFPPADERLPLVLGSRVLEFRPRFQERRGHRQTRGLVFGHRHCVTGHEVETRSVLGNPFFKPVGVELFDILGDLREPQASLVFIGGVSRHLRHERRGGGDLQVALAERPACRGSSGTCRRPAGSQWECRPAPASRSRRRAPLRR